MEPTNDVKIIFQEESGLWPVEGKLLTDDELQKLLELMPDTGWILITHPGAMFSNSQQAMDKVTSGLSESTIREMAAEKGLSEGARQDINKII